MFRGKDAEEEQRQRQQMESALNSIMVSQPEDIANQVLYLASPMGASVSGQAISVCGDTQMLS